MAAGIGQASGGIEENGRVKQTRRSRNGNHSYLLRHSNTNEEHQYRTVEVEGQQKPPTNNLSRSKDYKCGKAARKLKNI